MVALGVIVALYAALSSVANVSITPPSIKSKSTVFASATTQMIVDSPRSSLGDLQSDLAPLTERAGIFARFMTTPDALDYIGREAGIPGNAIAAQGPFEVGMPSASHSPSAVNKNGQVVRENPKYRLRFDQNPELPIVNIYAEAPSSSQAIALANGAARGLAKYLNDLEGQQQIPPNNRVDIRQLGQASGGVVNPGADKKIAALVFLLVLIAWCGLMLVAIRVRQGMKGIEDDPGKGLAPAMPRDSGAVVLPQAVKRGRSPVRQ